NATTGFNQQDASALEELGSMAGVAVENSRILATVTGQASKLDTALDALGEISQALTTVTQGSKVLEQKTLETAARVTGASAGLLTRTTPEGTQHVLSTLGNQGVVAVRNAELYDDNQRSIWELKNLQEALQAATSTLDLNQVLQQVLAGAAKASSAQIGCLALDESGRLILKGGFGTDSKTAEKLALQLGGDICKQVMTTKQPFMEAMERKPGTDSPLNPRAVLCVPITLRCTPLGVLFLANYQVGRVFSNDHRNLVSQP